MSDNRRTTTRRSLLAATTATLLGATAGCLSDSENVARAPGPSGNETYVPSTLDVGPAGGPPPQSGWTRTAQGQGGKTSTATTQQSTETASATTTPESTATPTEASPSTDSETAGETPTETATETATETPQTPSDFAHPYLSAGSGTAALGVDRSGYPVMGAPEAPVEILYWSDYLCTFCSTFSLRTHPKLIKQYVAPGTVRFVFLPFPFKGDNSKPASMLAGAIWQTVKGRSPSQFWQWHHRVFEHQKKPDSGWASIEKLSAHARAVGINMQRVQRHYNRNTQSLWNDIKAAKAAARKKWHPPGTPIFYVYNRETNAATKVTGTVPISNYKAAIAEVL